MTAKAIDYAGVSISALCIVHCVLLPVAAIALPIAGSLAEAEAFHKVLVLVAIVPAILAFSKIDPSKSAPFIRSLGVCGVLILLVGAFVEAFHDYETVLTVTGAVGLASAHILRSVSRRLHSH